MQQAESTYRAALEAAETNHRTALEVAKQQMSTERTAWLRDARRTSYSIFNTAVGQFRQTFVSEGFTEELAAHLNHIHEAQYEIRAVGPAETARLADLIYRHCWVVMAGRSARGTAEDREAAWKRSVSPLRAQLSEAMRQTLDETEQ